MLFTFSLGEGQTDPVSKLGDKCPSHLVNHLLTTLGEFGPEILLQRVFLHALPIFVEDALDVTDLKTLGDWVDEIMACSHYPGPSGCDASLATPVDSSVFPNDFLDINRVYCQDQRCMTFPQPSGAPSAATQLDWLCYLHHQFGTAARQCLPCMPCGQKTTSRLLVGVHGPRSPCDSVMS